MRVDVRYEVLGASRGERRPQGSVVWGRGPRGVQISVGGEYRSSLGLEGARQLRGEGPLLVTAGLAEMECVCPVRNTQTGRTFSHAITKQKKRYILNEIIFNNICFSYVHEYFKDLLELTAKIITLSKRSFINTQ